MSISKVPAAQTVRAGTSQPACFEGFRTSVELIDRVTVRRTMICECGGSQGILEAQQGWDNFPYSDPLSYTCLSCDSVRTFFDSHRDGYDNVMGNGATSTQGEKIKTVGCPTCNGYQFTVTSELLYNIEAEEIDEELDQSCDFGPSDCFDAINVYADCPNCKEHFCVGGWELA